MAPEASSLIASITKALTAEIAKDTRVSSTSPRLPGRSTTTCSNPFPSPRQRKMTSDLGEHLDEMMAIGLMTLEEANGYWQEDWEV